jgi:putative aminopeptidase FrvX
MELLKKLCSIHAPSGSEHPMTEFLLDYIHMSKPSWKVEPQVFSDGEFHDNIILIFGKPRTAIFAHIDSIGFTVRYDNQLVKIGGPAIRKGTKLVGNDNCGNIECEIRISEDAEGGQYLSALCERSIERGTSLTFKPDFREDETHVQCCYLDNRLGVWSALRVAETLENGAIVFSTREEHGGGSTAFIGKFLYEKFQIRQALISDITWVTEGVSSGKGVVVSLRDSGLPRRKYLDRILHLAGQSDIPFQIEVEGSGGSDGNELQRSSSPWEWCFIGAPEENVHSPNEKVHKDDIRGMVDMYRHLMKHM